MKYKSSGTFSAISKVLLNKSNRNRKVLGQGVGGFKFEIRTDWVFLLTQNSCSSGTGERDHGMGVK